MRLVLWSRIWSILVNVLCVFEKNIYMLFWVIYKCQLDQGGQLYLVSICFINYCEMNFEIQAVIFDFSTFQFCFCFMYFEILLLADKHLRLFYILLIYWLLSYYGMSLFILAIFFVKICIIKLTYTTTALATFD